MITFTKSDGTTQTITIPSGGGSGSGDDAYEWATVGNDNVLIPANKLGNAPKRTDDEIDARVEAKVEEWARDTTTLIPANKLTNAPSGGGSGTDTNSYFIDAWLRTPKGSTVSSSALTSPGTWNNDQDAPAFTTKPTTNVATGTVFDVSDLPASASTDDTFDYHRFRRIFTIGETNVPASSWKYLGQANHPIPTPGQILIQAFVRIQAGDVPTNTALTSGGVWDQQAQRFTTKPTNNVLNGVVYDRSDLPDDAVTSTEYDYWQYNRYYTDGEGTIAGSAWWRVGKLDQDPSGGGSSSPVYTFNALGLPQNDGIMPLTINLGQYVATDLTGNVVITQTDNISTLNGTFTVAVSDIVAAGSGGYTYRSSGTVSVIIKINGDVI